MESSPRSRWSYFLLEGMLIVFSVLLGFGISEWRADQADRDLARQVLESFRREIMANQDELVGALENHRDVLRQLESGSGASFSIRPALLRNTAWSTAQATGATVHLDYDVTEAAASVHERQELHREAQLMLFDQLADINLNPGGLPPEELQAMRRSAWRSFVSLEEKIVEEYGQALALIDSVRSRGDAVAGR